MASSTYLIALGSNRTGIHGRPNAQIRAALAAIGGVVAASPVIASDPLGPGTRRFANAAALIESDETPPALLARLKRIERAFGRRRGRRWGDRAIDVDIILWSRGAWASPGLTVPHLAFRTRGFVLTPALAIAAGWRDPVGGRTVAQLAHALRAVDPKRAGPYLRPRSGR